MSHTNLPRQYLEKKPGVRRVMAAGVFDLLHLGHVHYLTEAKKLGNELIVFHVLDSAEIDFSYDDASSFEDVESGEQLPVVPESFGDEYRKLIAAHSNALATRFSEHRIDYTLLNTSKPLDHALFSYLSSRERLMRVR